MKKVYGLLLLFIVAALLPVQPKDSLQPNPFALTHVTVIDATGAPPQPDMTLVIAKDRIIAMDRTGKVNLPADTLIVDAQGKFLIPGLWDMHVHTENKEMFFPLYIGNGITDVREM